MHPLKTITWFVIFLTSPALAADSSKISVGFLGGISFPSLSSGAFGYGAKADYKLLPGLGLGFAYYTFGIGMQTSTGNSSLVASTTNTTYAVEGLKDFADGFAAGAKMGLLSVQPNVNASNLDNKVQFSANDVYYFVAPVISYDYFLGHFSVGGELNYTYTLSGDAPKIVNLMATGKINF